MLNIDLLDPNDPIDAMSIRARQELDEYIATGKSTGEKQKQNEIGLTNDEALKAPVYCEICRTRQATETYDVDMFLVVDKEYNPFGGKMFRYRTQKVRVPCCHTCLTRSEKGNTIVSTVFLLSAIFVYLYLFSSVASGVLQHVAAFLFSMCITGFIGFPIFWLISFFCGQSKLYGKSATIKKFKSEGWKIGSKPSKCD